VSGPIRAAIDSHANARRMWLLLEPLHAVTYFTAEGRQRFEDAGLRGFWRGYFAGRAAPLGPVEAAPVVAMFFTFAPAVVQRALPAVWSLASPEQALLARREGAAQALIRLAGEVPGGPALAHGAMEEVVDSCRAAAEAVTTPGRPLAAANAALPWPDDPVQALWQATTILREHRGDGHVAALVAAGLDGCSILVLRCGHDLQRGALQPARGWTDEQWHAAAARLVADGLLDHDGRATPDGVRLLTKVELVTDTVAAGPWQALGVERSRRLAELVAPLSAHAAASMPLLSVIGAVRPETAGPAAG
jgi:hypothetical protein